MLLLKFYATYAADARMAYIRKAFFLLFCRALEFFCAFTALLVSEYKNGSLDESLLTVVYLAYDQSLKRHHNWFMRGTFYVRSHTCLYMHSSLNFPLL